MRMCLSQKKSLCAHSRHMQAANCLPALRERMRRSVRLDFHYHNDYNERALRHAALSLFTHKAGRYCFVTDLL